MVVVLSLVGLGIVDVLEAELGAEIPGEAFVGDHDAGLDQHLVNRAVEHQQQLLDLFDPHPRLGEYQGVGADIGAGRATRGQEASAAGRRCRHHHRQLPPLPPPLVRSATISVALP